MGVNDVGQLDTRVCGLLEVWEDPVVNPLALSLFGRLKADLLGWVGRVNDHGLLRLVVDYEVGIVVATPLP